MKRKHVGDDLSLIVVKISTHPVNKEKPIVKQSKRSNVNLSSTKINHVEHFQRHGAKTSSFSSAFSNWTDFLQVVRTFSAACDKDLYAKITLPHVVAKSTSRCFCVKQHTPLCKNMIHPFEDMKISSKTKLEFLSSADLFIVFIKSFRHARS